MALLLKQGHDTALSFQAAELKPNFWCIIRFFGLICGYSYIFFGQIVTTTLPSLLLSVLSARDEDLYPNPPPKKALLT